MSATASDAAQHSDKLAQALGVREDRVRQAMREAIAPDLASVQSPDPISGVAKQPPPDRIGGIAKQLGVSTEQVCAAFSSGTATGGFATGQLVSKGSSTAPRTFLNINGTQIDLDSNDPNQVSAPARKLGVTSERLLAAITQVEGPNRFYFAVPVPRLGH